MQQQRFSARTQLRGFYYAFSGVRKFILSERNASFHLASTVLAVVAAFFFRVSVSEAIALTVAIGLVWVAEMFNTCIEKTLDLISPEEDPAVGFIKDIGAGAVLLASGTALIIGLFIFIPKIL